MGGHADIEVNDGKAYIFYFTHPERTKENMENNTGDLKRSSIQVAELKVENGVLTCDRNADFDFELKNL